MSTGFWNSSVANDDIPFTYQVGVKWHVFTRGELIGVSLTSLAGLLSLTSISLLLFYTLYTLLRSHIPTHNSHNVSESFLPLQSPTKSKPKFTHTANPLWRTRIGTYLLNLLITDLIQSIAGTIQLHWVSQGRIDDNRICKLQATTLLLGDVGTATWSALIAFTTFTHIVLKSTESPWITTTSVIVGWTFCVFLTILGPLALTSSTSPLDEYFGIAGPWCFITSSHLLPRIFLHYLPMFISALVIFTSYFLVGAYLRGYLVVRNQGTSVSGSGSGIRIGKRKWGWTWKPDRFGMGMMGMGMGGNPTPRPPKSRFLHLSFLSTSSTSSTPTTPKSPQTTYIKSTSLKILLYPLAYILLILPDSASRLAALKGMTAPEWWWFLGMGLLFSMGFTNVLIYCTTRNILNIRKPQPPRTSISTSTLMQYTPRSSTSNPPYPWSSSASMGTDNNWNTPIRTAPQIPKLTLGSRMVDLTAEFHRFSAMAPSQPRSPSPMPVLTPLRMQPQMEGSSSTRPTEIPNWNSNSTLHENEIETEAARPQTPSHTYLLPTPRTLSPSPPSPSIYSLPSPSLYSQRQSTLPSTSSDPTPDPYPYPQSVHAVETFLSPPTFESVLTNSREREREGFIPIVL